MIFGHQLTRAVVLAACGVCGFGQTPPTQTFQVKDGHGIPVVLISEVKAFRFSKLYNQTVPAFQANVKNISGRDLRSVPIDASILTNGGDVVQFSFTALGVCGVCDFRSGATFLATYGAFFEPWPYTPETFGSIRFSVPDSWQSPEDDRLAEVERSARDARVRANCGEIYKNTSDKKIKDLTVKEGLRIRSCRELGLYH